jgi:hypothetical protein
MMTHLRRKPASMKLSAKGIQAEGLERDDLTAVRTPIGRLVCAARQLADFR